MIIEIPAPTLIAEGSTTQGQLTFTSSAYVFGVVEGEIHQQSLEVLQIGKTGWVHGNIRSQGPIVVEGRVEGDVSSTTVIRVMSTATIAGALHAPSIEVQAGAYVDGMFHIHKSRQQETSIRFAA